MEKRKRMFIKYHILINSIKFNKSDNYTINHFVNSVSFSRPKTKLKIIIGLNKNLH